MHQKISRHKLTLYNLPLGPGHYFRRGDYFVFGDFRGKRFGSNARSGSQSLWLPFNDLVGLKVFHPKGFSGTLRKAWTHFKVQRLLFGVGLAPEPFELVNLLVCLKNSDAVVTSDLFDVKFVEPVNVAGSPWRCYGITMGHVLKGSLSQVLENLERFGVEGDDFVCQTVYHYLLKRNDDALTLYEYQRLVNFFGGDERSVFCDILKEIKERLPYNIDVGNDLFSLRNVVLDENGEVKIVDCDCAGIKVC